MRADEKQGPRARRRGERRTRGEENKYDGATMKYEQERKEEAGENHAGWRARRPPMPPSCLALVEKACLFLNFSGILLPAVDPAQSAIRGRFKPQK